MSDQTQISVIIPVYNGAEFLAEAIASIRAQYYAPLEIIIVNDGSTDGTATLAQSLGTDIRYFYQPNAGPSAARNLGLIEAKGELIAFLDADDIWPEGSLELRLAAITSSPTALGVIGHTRGLLMLPAVNGMKSEAILSDPWCLPMLVGCGLYHRSIFERAGNFSNTMKHSEDLDWYLRLREANLPLLNIDAVTLHYRLHGHGLTSDKNIVQRGVLHALKLSLDRRRRLADDGTIRALPPMSIKEVE
jgi:glycosyltransferase involved in cell wall biosynthesis